MKALKRIAAILTTISMSASMISVVNAAGTPNGTPDKSEEYSENRGDIIYTILGTSPASTDGWYEPEGEEGYDTSYGDGSREGEDLDSLIPATNGEYTWEDGGLIWIAIQTEHIDRIQAMLNAAEGISNKNSGVYTWSLALAFDSNYFEFPASAGNYAHNQSDAFLSDDYPIGKSNRPMYSFSMEPEDPTTTECTTYKKLQDAEGAASLKALHLTADPAEINVCKVGITASNIGTTAAQSKALWQGTTISPAKQTMFVIPLKMKGDTAPQTKVLEGYFDGSVNTLTVGSVSTTAVAYNYDVRRDNKEKTNLNNYFNIKDYLLKAFPATYTVEYDANGTNYEGAHFKEEATDEQKQEKVPEDEKPTFKYRTEDGDEVEISSLLVPPEGMVFEGWYTEDGEPADADDFIVTEPIKLYAHYKNGYRVNFHLTAEDATYEDGTNTLKYIELGQGEQPVAGDIADNVGGNPTRTGYTFKGWYTKKNGAFDEQYTDDGANGSTKIETIMGQTELYAMWDNDGAGAYKLNFESNPPEGATATADANPAAVGYNNANDKLKTVIGGLPQEPTIDKNEYKFIGWYKNQAGDGDKLTEEKELLAYTGATADNPETTVYAKWGYVESQTEPDDPDYPDPKPNADTITIKFPKDAGADKYNGGTSKNGTLNDRYIKYNDTVPNLPTAAEMERDGKGFGGWYTEPENADGTMPLTAKKVEANTAINSEFGVNPTTGGTVNLYAHWVDKVTITYNMNGLAGTAPDPAKGTPGVDKFTPPKYDDITGHDSDYELVEWNTKKDGSGDSYAPDTEATVPDGDTTLYAIWNYDETKSDAVSVTFNGNDTEQYPATLTPNNGDPDTNKYTIVRKAGTKIDPEHFPTATRSTKNTTDNKYTFNHWDTNKTAAAGAQGEITVTAAEGTKTMDVYAIWTVTNDADKRTVTFKKDADDTDAYATVTVAVNDSVGPQMPANPTKDGHNFNKWLEGSNEFTAETVVTGNITVTADWTKELELKYERNGLPDTVTIPDPVKGNPGTSKTVGNIGNANGAQVTLVEWNTKADGSGDGYQPGASVTFDTTNPKNITLYAIWNSTDPNAKTITFLANDSTSINATLNPSDTGNTKQYTMKRATGQTVTAEQMPTATTPSTSNYELDHWGETATEAVLGEGETQAAITVGSEDITRYAIWKVKDDVTSYDVTFKLHDGTPQTEIGPIQVAAGDSVADRMPADPTRDGDYYTFNKWTTGTGASKADFDKDTPINADTVVDANWTMKVDVRFTVSEYPYDGAEHTPITAGNYFVFPKGETSGAISGLTLSTDIYKKVTGKTETEPPSYETEDLPADTKPSAGGEYTYGNLTLTGGDEFINYEVYSIPATFKITAKDIKITISDNYQYIGSGDSITPITTTATDVNDATITIKEEDLKVTFTDKDGKETNTMPTALGYYTIKVEAANDNYNITEVKDNYNHLGSAIPLYLINLQREIKVDYLGGINKNATDVYATVTLAKPTQLDDTSAAKTTLAGQTSELDVPQQGTDFDPPTGQRIKKFVTGTKEADNTITDPIDFDKDTVISFSETNEALTIYAIYENADWTLNFSDTKTNPAAETFDAYTVDAEKSVAQGLKKIGSTEVGATDPKELPAPTAAPENMMFKGWTTDQAVATAALAGLKSSDFEASGTYADKLFTDETVPTATELGDSNSITVYAVYVKSSDATLKSALFKEILIVKDDEGNPTSEDVKDNLPFANADYTVANPAITFKPETDIYTIVVKNDFEKILADLEPTQPGSTITVKVNGDTVTNETTGVPEGHTQAKPGVKATEYDKANSTNTFNTVIVTVTAPDGTTKDYTFNVLRYAKPRVELMPGNSPYGLIERMGTKYGGTWTDTEVEAAKAAFDASDSVYKTYGTGLNQFPSLWGNNTLYYSTSAWASYKKYNTEMIDELDVGEVTGPEITTERANYDMDPNAIFVYQLEQFTVPSIKAYDDFDREIKTNIDVTFKLKEQEDRAACKYSGETDADNAVTEIDAPLVSGTTDTYTLSDKVFRNDVYFINYVYHYTNANGEARRLKISRPVIILSRRGSLILNTDGLISDTDANYLSAFATAIYTGNSLVAYRVADLDGDTDQLINDTDANFLSANATMLYTSTNQYYKALSELN